MSKRFLNIDAFDYQLPLEAIAQQPAAARDASRLLVLDRATGATSHRSFRDLPELLSPGDLLVVNRSRVIPARLHARRASGGAVEVLLVQRLAGDDWEALLRPAARLRDGELLAVAPPCPPTADSPNHSLAIRILAAAPSAPDGRRPIRLEATGATADALVERLGHVPLPPYVRRPDAPEDRERYQTVYARERGSVAAPTAGLHFTPELLARLERRGVARAEVVLHVGPGTFQPVSVVDVRDHRVAPEPYVVPPEAAAALAAARARGGRVVAVGTTSVRVLETAATDAGTLAPGEGRTDLVVLPGHRFRAVDALVTNFHLPRSSLLLLVSAFAGRERVLAAYREAVAAGYRFYSYGDAMLIL